MIAGLVCFHVLPKPWTACQRARSFFPRGAKPMADDAPMKTYVPSKRAKGMEAGGRMPVKMPMKGKMPRKAMRKRMTIGHGGRRGY